MCVSMCMHAHVHARIGVMCIRMSQYMCGGQKTDCVTLSLPPPCGFQGQNSGYQAWPQAPFLTETSCSSPIYIVKKVKSCCTEKNTNTHMHVYKQGIICLQGIFLNLSH